MVVCARSSAGKFKTYDDMPPLSPDVLRIPGSRSNVWPHSWKRFMVDFAYARGLLTLYPNLPGELGLATTLQLSEAHAAGWARDSDMLFPTDASLRRNVRIARLLQRNGGILDALRLTDYADLPVSL